MDFTLKFSYRVLKSLGYIEVIQNEYIVNFHPPFSAEFLIHKKGKKEWEFQKLFFCSMAYIYI